MASYYPEGECFFVRKSLRYAGEWSAENPEQFYSHVLVEYMWNGWACAQKECQNMSHPRSEMQTGKAQGFYNTLFGDWDRFYVGESKDKSPSNMLAVTSYRNSLNWNECRDFDKGGPRKYILRPVKIRHPDTQWLWIDATIPLRAIYFPLCHKTDEAFQDYCTYIVIDFRARNSLQMTDLVGNVKTYQLSSTGGLGRRTELTWGFKVPDIMTYLALPRQLRNQNYGLFRSRTKGDELVVRAASSRTWDCPDGALHMNRFYREMDYANIICATFGVDIGWRPYKYSSFILKMVTMVVELGLGFVPGVGPLLSVAFGLGVQLLDDPDSFCDDNVLEISSAVMDSLVSAAGSKKKYLASDALPRGLLAKNSAPAALVSAAAPLALEGRTERQKLDDEYNALLTENLQQDYAEQLAMDSNSLVWLVRFDDFRNGQDAGHTDEHLTLDKAANTINEELREHVPGVSETEDLLGKATDTIHTKLI